MDFFSFSKFKENWIFLATAFLIFFLPFQFALNPAKGFDLAFARVFISVLFLFFLLFKFKIEYLSFKNPVSRFLFIFLILTTLSFLSTHNFLWSLRKLAFILSIFPIYLISLHVFKNKEHQEKLFMAFAAGSTLLALLSLMQFIAQFIFGINNVYQFLANYTAPFFLGNSFAKTVLAYPSWLVASEGATYMRAVGTFPDPHMLSYFLGLSLPWTIILAIQKKSKLLWLGSSLILLTDIATFTRGGYIALIASAFIILPLVNKEALRKILLSIAFVATLFVIAPHSPVAGRLTSSFDTQEGSNVARLSNWQQALLIIKQNPLGVGIGMYSLAVDPKADYRTPIYAHNLYLDIAAELGLIAALVFIALLCVTFITFWKAAKKDYFFIAGVASITLFSVHSLVESPLYSVHILPIFFLILALAASMRSNETIFCLPLYLLKVTIWIFPTNLLEILALLSSAYILFSQRKMALEKLQSIPKPFLIAIVLLLFGTTSSIITNNDWQTGFGILKGWFLIPIIFSFSLFITIDSIHKLEKIYRTIFFSSSVVAIIALLYKILALVTYDNRLTAFYLSPNHLAMYLAPGLIFGMYSKKLKCDWLRLIMISIIIISLYFTYSFGAWITLLFSFFILIISKKRFSLKYLLFFFMFLLMLIITQINSPKVQDIFHNFSRSSLSSRLTIWNVSLRLIKENPIFGIGPGNFQNSYLSKQIYYPPFLEWAVPQPHNIFLAFWLQAGLIGLIGFLIILYFVFKKLFLLMHNKNAALAAPLLTFFIYTLSHGIVDTTYWKNDLSFLFWIAVFSIVFLLTCSHEKMDKS